MRLSTRARERERERVREREREKRVGGREGEMEIIQQEPHRKRISFQPSLKHEETEKKHIYIQIFDSCI